MNADRDQQPHEIDRRGSDTGAQRPSNGSPTDMAGLTKLGTHQHRCNRRLGCWTRPARNGDIRLRRSKTRRSHACPSNSELWKPNSGQIFGQPILRTSRPFIRPLPTGRPPLKCSRLSWLAPCKVQAGAAQHKWQPPTSSQKRAGAVRRCGISPRIDNRPVLRSALSGPPPAREQIMYKGFVMLCLRQPMRAAVRAPSGVDKISGLRVVPARFLGIELPDIRMRRKKESGGEARKREP